RRLGPRPGPSDRDPRPKSFRRVLRSKHSILPLGGCKTTVIPVTEPRLFDILQSGPWPTGGAAPDLDIVDRQSGDREWRQAALNGSIRPKAMGLFSRKAGAEMSLFTSRQSNVLD